MISQPKRHQNRTSNRNFLPQFLLFTIYFYCFIGTYKKFSCSLFISLSILFIHIWIQHNERKKKYCCDRSRRINCQLLFIIAVFFSPFAHNFQYTLSCARSARLLHMVFVASFFSLVWRPRYFIYEHDFIKQNNNNVCLSLTNKHIMSVCHLFWCTFWPQTKQMIHSLFSAVTSIRSAFFSANN